MTTEHDDHIAEIEELDGVMLDEQRELRTQMAELQLRLRCGSLFTLEPEELEQLLELGVVHEPALD